MNRRQYLAILGTTLLAGCSEDSGNGGSGDSTPTSSPEATETPTPSDTPEAGTTTETSTTSPTSTVAQTATPDRNVSAVIGETVSDDQLSMVVRSLSKTRSLGEYQEADPGNTYAIVRLVVKNKTQDSFADFSQFFQTQLKDSEGYTYTPSLNISGSAFEGGQLAPGEVARGDIAFEIPQEASGLTLLFDFSAFSFFEFNRVTVDLSQEASTIADLQQSLHVPSHQVGESVTHDGVTVTVNSAEFKTSMGEYTQAPQGKEYAIVDVTTKNGTDEVVNFSALLQMGMKDGTGRAFSYSAVASGQLTRNYSGGEVGPGEQIRGKVAFEVPQGVYPMYFTFEYSVISGGSKTFWQLR